MNKDFLISIAVVISIIVIGVIVLIVCVGPADAEQGKCDISGEMVEAHDLYCTEGFGTAVRVHKRYADMVDQKWSEFYDKHRAKQEIWHEAIRNDMNTWKRQVKEPVVIR